ncbi:tRNA1(Val) (adenine(37)-N6)-methyltransferase [Enterovibrio norvegicus]|uniref:tRNA1(Val) (adenine(37)-N6)-methyltransferase n=1 Tax=Enterovibrio norvegicus TaxID=188144 RepID=UPI0024B0AEFA|nr:methyltransferase [Enterovibrio norvegicus]
MSKGFQFKQFSIEDNGCGMPVSTDGVLLGAWAHVAEDDAVLDIGTGTGLLSLMLAQRALSATIMAVDIDQHATETAALNASSSPWADRITVVQQDVTHWDIPTQFDTIICNPPYFNSGEQANDARRATARHTDTLSHTMLLKVINARLLPTGQAHLILPSVEADKLIAAAETHHLVCQRITEVKATANKPVTRKLITLAPKTALSSSISSKNTSVQHLVIQDKGAYTQDFISLTKDFYLKM